MNEHPFDELAKALAEKLTRRQALWRLLGGMGGTMLGWLGLAGRGGADTHRNCNVYCQQHFTTLNDRARCKQICAACPSTALLCGLGASAATLTCCTPLPHANVGCVSNACQIVGCETGWGDCDHIKANGCETSISNDPANCGACSNACPAHANATTTCVNSTCDFTCNASLSKCNGTCVNTTNDPANCGSCSNACPAHANATTTCVSSTCDFTCNASLSKCNGICVNTTNDPANCGACSNACPAHANATTTCVNSTCSFTCNAGLTSCNGTCVNTTNDPANCGACSNACQQGHACVNSACT